MLETALSFARELFLCVISLIEETLILICSILSFSSSAAFDILINEFDTSVTKLLISSNIEDDYDTVS
mgnify:CR=1 FL=1